MDGLIMLLWAIFHNSTYVISYPVPYGLQVDSQKPEVQTSVCRPYSPMLVTFYANETKQKSIRKNAHFENSSFEGFAANCDTTVRLGPGCVTHRQPQHRKLNDCNPLVQRLFGVNRFGLIIFFSKKKNPRFGTVRSGKRGG